MTEAVTDVERWGVPEAVTMVEVCSAVVLAEELSPVVAGVVPVLPYHWGQLKENSMGLKGLSYSFGLGSLRGGFGNRGGAFSGSGCGGGRRSLL